MHFYLSKGLTCVIICSYCNGHLIKRSKSGEKISVRDPISFLVSFRLSRKKNETYIEGSSGIRMDAIGCTKLLLLDLLYFMSINNLKQKPKEETRSAINHFYMSHSLMNRTVIILTLDT